MVESEGQSVREEEGGGEEERQGNTEGNGEKNSDVEKGDRERLESDR